LSAQLHVELSQFFSLRKYGSTASMPAGVKRAAASA
jgi:hypothetical protein